MLTPEPIDPMEVAAQLFPDLPPGFPYENFETQELILPDGEDMGIKSDDDAINEDEVQTDTGFGACVVITGLPVVPADKFDKLMGVVRKIAEGVEGLPAPPKPEGYFMPQDSSEQKMTKGFAFVEYQTAKAARLFRDSLNLGPTGEGKGTSLDKKHTMYAYMLDDIDTYAKVPDEYVPQPLVPYKPQGNLFSWMMDKVGRDQFLIRHRDTTEVFWNDGKRGRVEEAYKREFWTESFVQWSPQGTMIATMHRQGVALWGGATFERIARFAHANVRFLDFSPNENYVCTYTSHEPRGPHESFTINLNVYDVKANKLARPFDGPAEKYAVGAQAGPGGALKWPVFKWAGGKEDKYFARLGKNKERRAVLCVYETSTMDMLPALVGGVEKPAPIAVENLYDFEWSPSEPLMACYMTEQLNTPAKILLLRIPEKTEARQKNLFDVNDVKLCWHPQGDFLAVKVDRYTKTKKSTYTGFEIFSIRDKDIPMEVFELPNKGEKVVTFAWEPKGHRLAVVHGDGPRPSISFFSMRDEKGRLSVKLQGTITNRPCNSIFWSPMGKYIVIAGLKNLNGQLEFFNVDDMETMATAEHFMATDVEWDPTGRYVATSLTSVQQMENGYNMWSFSGKQLLAKPTDRLFQFSWRPRVPSLLSPEKENDIVKNLKAYTKRYDEEDEALLMQADADVLQERQAMQDLWSNFLQQRRDMAATAAEFAKKMYGPRYEEGEYTLQNTMVEQTIDVKEEPYNK